MVYLLNGSAGARTLEVVVADRDSSCRDDGSGIYDGDGRGSSLSRLSSVSYHVLSASCWQVDVQAGRWDGDVSS
jgi:hypothetical protein